MASVLTRHYRPLRLRMMKRGCNRGTLRELQGSGVSRLATWARRGGALGKYAGRLWAEDSGERAQSREENQCFATDLRLLPRLKRKRFYLYF